MKKLCIIFGIISNSRTSIQQWIIHLETKNNMIEIPLLTVTSVKKLVDIQNKNLSTTVNVSIEQNLIKIREYLFLITNHVWIKIMSKRLI